MPIWSFERLFDPPERVEVKERDHEATMRPRPARPGDPPWFRCRVCGLEGEEGSYCPTCLADTMCATTAVKRG